MVGELRRRTSWENFCGRVPRKKFGARTQQIKGGGLPHGCACILTGSSCLGPKRKQRLLGPTFRRRLYLDGRLAVHERGGNLLYIGYSLRRGRGHEGLLILVLTPFLKNYTRPCSFRSCLGAIPQVANIRLLHHTRNYTRYYHWMQEDSSFHQLLVIRHQRGFFCPNFGQ